MVQFSKLGEMNTMVLIKVSADILPLVFARLPQGYHSERGVGGEGMGIGKGWGYLAMFEVYKIQEATSKTSKNV